MGDVTDTIQTNAQAPQSAKGNAGEVREHSLKHQTDANRYLASASSAYRFSSIASLTATGSSAVWPGHLVHPHHGAAGKAFHRDSIIHKDRMIEVDFPTASDAIDPHAVASSSRPAVFVSRDFLH